MNADYKIEESKSGLPTISVTGENGKRMYLHSRYDPSKETGSLTDKFNPEKYDTVIVLGAGLGYHLLPLEKISGRYKRIIIVDAIRDLEKEIEKNPETRSLLESGKIAFLSGIEIQAVEPLLEKEINIDETKGINLIEHPPSIRAFGDYYNKISKIVQKIINKKAADAATKKTFGWLYLKNIFSNLNSLSCHYPVSCFLEKFSDYPALVITSGPSLEKQLGIIRGREDRFFIIAVDSVAGTLLQNGTIPDFVISIDPQPFTFEHLFDLDMRNIIPIYSISSHPLAFTLKPGLVSLNTHPLSQIIDKLSTGKIGSINSRTGTVAGDAINTSRLFGFSPIALAGFDFSFPGYKIYPRGTAYQRRYTNSAGRFSPVETANMNYIMKSSRGVKHCGRFSRRSFIQYKESVENFFVKNSAKNFYNVNALGVGIDGVQEGTLSRFIEEFCINKIDKKEITGRIIVDAITVGGILDENEILDLLGNEALLDEVIRESVGEMDERRRGKMRELLEMNLK